MMEIIFLGTSSMQPTKDRNTSAVFLSYNGIGFLFDCGEGTQRQIKTAGLNVNDIDYLFITHWHGDHVFGVPGLLQTLASANPEKHLHIYGPKGTKKNLKKLLKSFELKEKIEITVQETKKGKFLNAEKYYVEATPLEHGIPCLGYAFVEKDRRRINLNYVNKIGIPEGQILGKLQSGKTIEFKGEKITPIKATYVVKGKKITYITDTLFCNNAVNLSKNSDILICESSYADSLTEKAEENKHMTAKQAAMLATHSNAKKLVLTHFSQRYKTTEELLEEAKSIFPNTTCAYDFMKIKA